MDDQDLATALAAADRELEELRRRLEDAHAWADTLYAEDCRRRRAAREDDEEVTSEMPAARPRLLHASR